MIAAAAVAVDSITEAQRALPPLRMVDTEPEHFERNARWWDLEAGRGYASAPDSLRYAANLRERAAALRTSRA